MTDEPEDRQRAIRAGKPPTRSMIDAMTRVKTESAKAMLAAMDRISAAELRAKLDVDEKWIKARLKDQGCGFPQPEKENGRLYWSKKEIDRWMVAQVLKVHPQDRRA